MKLLFAAAALAMVCTAALANDSIATLGAGGLVLIQADSITMDKEVLFISPDEVKVDYVFRNRAPEDKSHYVAFPMPLIGPYHYNEGDIALADREADNFMRFAVTVNGEAVEPQIEMRALAGVLDVTDQLSQAGVPLNPLQPRTVKALATVAPDVLKSLYDLGIIGTGEGAPFPRWTLKATYFWRQAFPANADVHVSHRYQPGTGAWFYYPEMLDDAAIVSRYCIDEGTKKAMRRGTRDGRAMALAKEVSYVLTTGANWSGPIADFRLVIDKLDPDSVLSLCMNDVKKISATQFEVRRKDFIPDKDLTVLVMQPMPKE
jgi:Domain of unknown function (DUF4424)